MAISRNDEIGNDNTVTAPEMPRRGPPPVEQVGKNDPFGLQLLSFRRYSVRHMSLLLLATLLSAGVAAQAGLKGEYAIAATAIAGFVISSLVMGLMMRAVIRRNFVEAWIRRLGMGDFEYTVRPWGDDELSKVCIALETLRNKAIEAMQLNEVKTLSDALAVKNQELESAIADLERTQDQMVSSRKVAELGELAAGVAHEISNPLSFVLNFADDNDELTKELSELLDGDNGEAAELLAMLQSNNERITRNVTRANAVVNAVNSMNSQAPKQYEVISLNQLAAHHADVALRTAQQQHDRLPDEITYQLSPDSPAVRAIPADLARIVTNTVLNAAQAVAVQARAADGAYRPCITVSTALQENGANGAKVELTVSDNGIGVPAENLNKIFNPFFTTKPGGTGAGLGLSVCHDVAREHGGDIKMESQPGNGAIVTVTLPAAAADFDTEDEADE